MIPPLMGRKKAVSIILGMGEKPEVPEQSGDAMRIAAEDLIRAVADKDVAAVADALKAAFHCLEAYEDQGE